MKPLLTVAILAALAVSTPALADKDKGKHKHHRDKHGHYEPGHRHDNGRHLGHYKQWARGEHLPPDYLVSRYYVDDYRAYRLAPPPDGYRWVRPYEEDETYYLVQVATGLIAQIFGG